MRTIISLNISSFKKSSGCYLQRPFYSYINNISNVTKASQGLGSLRVNLLQLQVSGKISGNKNKFESFVREAQLKLKFTHCKVARFMKI